MAENQTILELQHISKYFPGVKALDDVNFKLKRARFTFCAEKTGLENLR